MTRKEYHLMQLADICEVAFTLSAFNYFINYLLWYYSVNRFMTVASVLLATSCILFCSFSLAVCIAGRDTTKYDRSHTFLGVLRKRKPVYKKLPMKLKLSYLWKHWVIGINIKKLLKLLAVLSITLFSFLCGFLAVKDSWQYSDVLAPCFTIIGIVLSYFCYRMTGTIFRSGQGLYEYLLRTKESLQDTTDDFKNAKVVSRNLRISQNRLFYRDSNGVILIRFDCVKKYLLRDNLIFILPIWETEVYSLYLKTDTEYCAVSSRLLRL